MHIDRDIRAGTAVVHVGFIKAASTFMEEVAFPAIPGYDVYGCRDNQPPALDRLASRFLCTDPPDAADLAFVRSKHILTNPLIFGLRNHQSVIDREPDHNRAILLSNVLRLYGSSARYLVVIRRQDSLANSLMRYKSGMYSAAENLFVDFPYRRTPDRLVHVSGGDGGIYLDSLDFYTRIMELANVVGPDRVHILVYEDVAKDRDRFISELEKVFEMPLDAVRAKMDDKRMVSPKVPMAVPRFRHAGLVDKLPAPVADAGRRIGRKVLARPVRMSDDFRAELLAVFRTSNRALSDAFGLELDRYGYF